MIESAMDILPQITAGITELNSGSTLEVKVGSQWNMDPSSKPAIGALVVVATAVGQIKPGIAQLGMSH